MATKTISIELDVYERLKALRQSPSESFSRVLRRVLVGPKIMGASDLAEMIREGRVPDLGLSETDFAILDAAQEEELEYARSRTKRKAG